MKPNPKKMAWSELGRIDSRMEISVIYNQDLVFRLSISV